MRNGGGLLIGGCKQEAEPVFRFRGCWLCFGSLPKGLERAFTVAGPQKIFRARFPIRGSISLYSCAD